MMSEFDPWSFQPASGYSTGLVLAGYQVATFDGDIGKVAEATYGPGAAGLVVDIGPSLIGHRVLLPAGLVKRVDVDDRRIYVDCVSAEIKDAPVYDPDSGIDDDYRAQLGAYYYRDNRPQQTDR
jgi:hypothetical protein